MLLATILLTSGLTAALTATWLRGDQKQQVAAAKRVAPHTEPNADSKSAEPAAQQPPAIRAEATSRQGEKAMGRQGDGESDAAEHNGAAKQDGAVVPPKADAPSEEPRGDNATEPLDVAGEARKTPMPKPLTGLVDEPKSELLGKSDEPTLPVVADTPEGLYAARTQPKTAEFLGERGGTLKSQKAVEDGLNWLARHQGADGHWGADCLGSDPNSRCEKKAPCQGPGMHFEIAHTGLALLAFQAAGQYDFNGQKYSDQVAKGLDYLVQRQAQDGCIDNSQISQLTAEVEGTQTAQEKAAIAALPAEWKQKFAGPRSGSFMYEHAIAAMALCEACVVALAEGEKPD
ncbi:MAG TPA: hypothetical protein VJ783_14150, partial [Pirellulales bacterium]|nr:hypothetical protein [Pirellulales bacterium]